MLVVVVVKETQGEADVVNGEGDTADGGLGFGGGWFAMSG